CLFRPRRLPRRHRWSLPAARARDPRCGDGDGDRGASAARRRGGGWRRACMTPVLMAAPDGGLEVFRRGKVRDTFVLDDGSLLMVATDRLSAFDVVLPDPIPDKGRVLTQIARWWFDKTSHIVPNHLLPDRDDVVPPEVWAEWRDRSMRCTRASRIDIECVV